MSVEGTTSTDAIRWTCSRCGVSVGRIDSSPTALPTTWTQGEGVSHCLGCSRALAGEAAIDAAPDDSSREELLKIRRTGLIEFEIDRDPESPDRTVARACGTSPAAVASIRRTMAEPVADDRT